MSSIKSLYIGSNTTPVIKPLVKGSISYSYKAAHFGNKPENTKDTSSIKNLYNRIENNQSINIVEFISYNDDYSLPKKPKFLYPIKNKK